MMLAEPNFPSYAVRIAAFDRPTEEGQAPTFAEQGWTFGHDVISASTYARYGQDLCCVVAWCLCANPNMRPDLKELQDAIWESMNQDGRPASAWRTDFFQDPHAPPVLHQDGILRTVSCAEVWMT